MKTLSALTAILLAMIRFPIGAAGADKDQNTGHNLPRPARVDRAALDKLVAAYSPRRR